MTRNTSNSSERGSAIIVVLSLMMMIGLLAASAVSLSQITQRTAKVASARGEMAYVDEGAAARVEWLLINDIVKNPDRSPSADVGPAAIKDALAVPRLPLKGKIDYYGVKVDYDIADLISGIDISGADAGAKIKAALGSNEDFQESIELDKFIDCVNDYVDPDDFIGMYGFEHNDYLSKDGLANLPRNGPMRFREEILLVHEALKYFKPDDTGRMSDFMVIPPIGMTKPKGKDSFWSATSASLVSKCALTEAEAKNAIELRNLQRAGTIGFDEMKTRLGENYTALARVFEFNESGYYTITITGGEGFRRTLVFSIALIKGSLPPPNGNQYFEWVLY